MVSVSKLNILFLLTTSWFSLKVIFSPWLPSFKFSKSSKLYLASLSAKKKRVSFTFTGPTLVKPLSVRDLVSKKAASPLNTNDYPSILSAILCRPLVFKVRSRLESWKARTLSFAGRLEQVKSVLYSLQTYWASAFHLPRSIMKEVEVLLMNFLLRGANSSPKIHCISRSSLCRPKKEGLACAGYTTGMMLPKQKAALVPNL